MPIGWIGAPTTAGLLARKLALAMCGTHLGAGHDVLVPQFLGRPEFVLALERVAAGAGVPFVEIALVLGPERAAQRVAQRSARPERPALTGGTEQPRRPSLSLASTQGRAPGAAGRRGRPGGQPWG
jgi:predicted kinase